MVKSIFILTKNKDGPQSPGKRLLVCIYDAGHGQLLKNTKYSWIGFLNQRNPDATHYRGRNMTYRTTKQKG
jgi:hypothetical protein